MRARIRVTIVALAASACRQRSAATRRAPAAAAAAAAPPPPAPRPPAYFTVPADQLPHLHIGAGRPSRLVDRRAHHRTVEWDNDHTTQAITQVSGPITRIVVDTGARVKAGDPLLYVASADVTNAISTIARRRTASTSRSARSTAARICWSTRRSRSAIWSPPRPTSTTPRPICRRRSRR